MLPREILYRKKQGFSVPLDHWSRRELRDLAYDVIFSGNDGILSRSYLQKIWNQHQKRQFDRSAYPWAVLMFRKRQQVFHA